MFLVKAAKLASARLCWDELGESGLGKPGDQEPLIPAEALPCLEAAMLLNRVVDSTMGDRLVPHYRELIASYGRVLTTLLAHAKNTLGQAKKTVVTWKEHILVIGRFLKLPILKITFVHAAKLFQLEH